MQIRKPFSTQDSHNTKTLALNDQRVNVNSSNAELPLSSITDEDKKALSEENDYEIVSLYQSTPSTSNDPTPSSTPCLTPSSPTLPPAAPATLLRPLQAENSTPSQDPQNQQSMHRLPQQEEEETQFNPATPSTHTATTIPTSINPSNHPNLQSLPPELLPQLVQHLPYPDHLALKHVCRHFYLHLPPTTVSSRVNWLLARRRRGLPCPYTHGVYCSYSFHFVPKNLSNAIMTFLASSVFFLTRLGAHLFSTRQALNWLARHQHRINICAAHTPSTGGHLNLATDAAFCRSGAGEMIRCRIRHGECGVKGLVMRRRGFPCEWRWLYLNSCEIFLEDERVGSAPSILSSLRWKRRWECRGRGRWGSPWGRKSRKGKFWWALGLVGLWICCGDLTRALMVLSAPAAAVYVLRGW